jgi:hypothetical protein
MLAPALLLLCVVAYMTSFLAVRQWVSCAVVVLAMPLVVAWRVPNTASVDRTLRWIVAAMVGLVVWHCLQLGWVTPLVDIGLGRAGLFAAATALAIAGATALEQPEALFPAIGVSALAAMVVALTGVWLTGYDGFGLGNPNHLLAACCPAQLGWCAWLIRSAVLRQAVPRWQYVAAALLTILLWHQVFWAIPGYPRRGVIAATATVSAVFAGAWLWRARRPLALALAGGLAIVALAGSIRLFSHPVVDSRNERALMYAAAWQAGVASLPWGGGSYCSLRLSGFEGESARHFAATNSWTFHVHDEPLEELMCGGLPGLALLLGGAALVAWRTMRIREPAQRWGAGAIGIAMCVHAATDNAFAVPAVIGWGGVLLGAMLRCPAGPPAPTRWLGATAWVLALGAGAALVRELPSVALPLWADGDERLRAVQASGMADFQVTEWPHGLDLMLDEGRIPDAERFLAAVRGKIGYGANVGLAACIIPGRAGEADRERVTAALADLRRHPLSALGALASAATAAARHDTEELAAAIAYIHRAPFNRIGYDHLDEVLSRRHDLIPLVPKRDVVRLHYRRGDHGLPLPVWQAPRDIDEAADLMAALMWANQRGADPRLMSPWLESLVARYGDIPDVCLLTVEMVRDVPEGSYPWLTAHLPILVRASEKIYPADRLRLLRSVEDARQARRAWPLLSAMYPATARSLDENRMNHVRENADDIWTELVRIHALLRQTLADAHAAAPVGSAP